MTLVQQETSDGSRLNREATSRVTLATAILAVTVFGMHGAVFLFLKTTGDVRQRLKCWLWHTWGLFLAANMLVSMVTLIENAHVVAKIKQVPWAIPIVILNVLCVANIPRAVFNEKYGQAFVSSCVNNACLVDLFAASTFPSLVYSTAESTSIDIYSGASSQGALWIMSISAMIGTPLINSYTAIIYWTFRHPVS